MTRLVRAFMGHGFAFFHLNLVCFPLFRYIFTISNFTIRAELLL